MKKYTNQIDKIVAQIDNIQRAIIEKNPFGDRENHEEALDELTRAATCLEDVCSVFEREEAYKDAKNQMELNL
jgi:hypothetical protein